jgi:hypothetical protein
LPPAEQALRLRGSGQSKLCGYIVKCIFKAARWPPFFIFAWILTNQWFLCILVDMNREFHINKSLIWDYDFHGRYDTEEFKKWYISRVLSCGTKDDICQLGIDVIKKYFTHLNLPTKIKKFWEWYFTYAHIH